MKPASKWQMFLLAAIELFVIAVPAARRAMLSIFERSQGLGDTLYRIYDRLESLDVLATEPPDDRPHRIWGEEFGVVSDEFYTDSNFQPVLTHASRLVEEGIHASIYEAWGTAQMQAKQEELLRREIEILAREQEEDLRSVA